MLVVACPGQGSQSEGFLSSWISEVPGFRAELERLSGFCELDLIELGTSAAEEVIKDTSNAQPLIVAAAIASYRTLFEAADVSGVVGHSVGEFAAAAISGVLSDESAMRLVKIRADAMAEAAGLEPTSMAAVLGGEIELIASHLDSLGISIANYNGAGQVVAAGGKDAISELVGNPPEKTRVIELKVAGAFHTGYMESARLRLREAADQVESSDPKLALWSNFDGAFVTSGAAFLDSLVNQVSRPVRWDLCMESLAKIAPAFVELPPAGALTGLVKRGIPGSNPIALKAPSDFEKVSA